MSGWRCGELWWWWWLWNDASGGNVAGLKGSVSQPTVMSACEVQSGGGVVALGIGVAFCNRMRGLIIPPL